MPRGWVTRAVARVKEEQNLQPRLYAALGSLKRLQDHLTYSCETGRLKYGLDGRFFELSANQSTFDFLNAHKAHTSIGAMMRSAAGMFLSNTDANTLLGMYKMHVLDTDNARLFLDGPCPHGGGGEDAHAPAHPRTPASRGSLLDVGAGDGHVTAEIMGLFETVLATEVSRPALWRLRQKGVPCAHIGSLEELAGEAYDTVCCLNVLDRCSRPLSLLREMRGLVRPGTGRLLLAVVLPFRPFVEMGWGGALGYPEERLGMDPGLSWEESVNALYHKVLQPEGFEVERLSRVPYLCQGDVGSVFYELDDALFLLKVRE